MEADVSQSGTPTVMQSISPNRRIGTDNALVLTGFGPTFEWPIGSYRAGPFLFPVCLSLGSGPRLRFLTRRIPRKTLIASGVSRTLPAREGSNVSRVEPIN